MNTLELPPQSSLEEDWRRFERRPARRRLRSTDTAPPAAVWINRPGLHGRVGPRSLAALLALSLVASVLWGVAY